MSLPVKDIISMLREELSGYNVTDDNVLDDVYLLDKCNQVRQVLILQEHKQLKDLSYYYNPPICCLEVECIENECVIEGYTFPTGTVQHYVDLPPLMKQLNGRELAVLGTDNMQFRVNMTTIGGFLSSDARRYTANKMYGFRTGDRVYIKNIGNTKRLCLIGILYDPTQACNWKNDTTPYPVPDSYKLGIIVKQEILRSMGIPADEIQNFRNDIGKQQINQINQQYNQNNEEE
jgi:hypothetical protein